MEQGKKWVLGQNLKKEGGLYKKGRFGIFCQQCISIV